VGIYLGIDTSSSFLSLALWSPEGLEISFQEAIGRDHAKRLIYELDSLFERAKVKKTGLTAIGIGIGPGSYTGLRVGIASAKGLSRALGVPLGGVDSLAASAYGCLNTGEQGWITVDARRGNVYAGLYQKTQHGGILTLQEAQKQEFSQLQQVYSGPFLQDKAPDALYIAQQAQKPLQVAQALYL
jgi:tRNA threonylcarbamoyladenosine biosynthesis protein TsaB